MTHNLLSESVRSVSIVTGLRVGRPGYDSRQGRRRDISLLTTASRPALGPTQTPIQWVPGALSPKVKRPGVLTIHLQPVSRLGMRGAIPPLPHPFSRCGAQLSIGYLFGTQHLCDGKIEGIRALGRTDFWHEGGHTRWGGGGLGSVTYDVNLHKT
jgi:hypothetical protein